MEGRGRTERKRSKHNQGAVMLADAAAHKCVAGQKVRLGTFFKRTRVQKKKRKEVCHKCGKKRRAKEKYKCIFKEQVHKESCRTASCCGALCGLVMSDS